MLGHAGCVRRPPARRGRRGAGGPGRRGGRHLRSRTPSRRRGPARRRHPGAPGEQPGEGGAHQRQPRLCAAARVQLAADRRGWSVHPHRRQRGRHAGAARRRARLGRRLRHPLPRPRLRPRAVGPHGPLARGRADRGDATHQHRPRQPQRAVRRTRACVRRRRRAERLRARHQRRRREPGADQRLRRHRLHRARPPARPAHADRVRAVLRLAAGLLVLRGRSHQGLVAGRPRPRRWHPRRVRRGAGPPPARPTPRHHRRAAQRRPPQDARAVLGAGDADRRHSPAPGYGPAPDPLPAHARARVRAGRRRPAQRSGRPDHRPLRPRDRPRLAAELRGTPATDAESALLRDACDACCADPDFDVLVSG